MYYAYVSSSTQKTEARNQSSRPTYIADKVQNRFSYLRKNTVANYIINFYILNIFKYYNNPNKYIIYTYVIYVYVYMHLYYSSRYI